MFVDALTIRPNFSQALWQLADLNFSEGKLADARQEIDSFLAANQETPDLLLLAVKVTRAQRDALDAELYARRLQLDFPDSAEARAAGLPRPQPGLTAMAEGIGARLRGARERSRLTILQAAERLHVDPDILEALEADDFAALGAPVYVKGHLRHYAELVGESPEALFELYSQGNRVPPPDLTRVPKPVADDTGRLVAPAVIVVIGFAVAGTVWWGLSLSHRHWLDCGSRPVPITVPAATPAEPDQPVVLTPAGRRCTLRPPRALATQPRRRSLRTGRSKQYSYTPTTAGRRSTTPPGGGCSMACPWGVRRAGWKAFRRSASCSAMPAASRSRLAADRSRSRPSCAPITPHGF